MGENIYERIIEAICFIISPSYTPVFCNSAMVLGNVLYLGFLGLFISVGTKREPVLFEVQEADEQDDAEDAE